MIANLTGGKVIVIRQEAFAHLRVQGFDRVSKRIVIAVIYLLTVRRGFDSDKSVEVLLYKYSHGL